MIRGVCCSAGAGGAPTEQKQQPRARAHAGARELGREGRGLHTRARLKHCLSVMRAMHLKDPEPLVKCVQHDPLCALRFGESGEAPES